MKDVPDSAEASGQRNQPGGVPPRRRSRSEPGAGAVASEPTKRAKRKAVPVAAAADEGETSCSWMFAYGSNGLDQLRERVGRVGPFEHRPGYLAEHARIFAGHSDRWGGSVASVHPCPGQRVAGMLVRLTQEEIRRLDAFEGGYTRTVVDVRFCSSDAVAAALGHAGAAAGPANPAGDGPAGATPDPASEETCRSYIYKKNNYAYRGPPSVAYLTAIDTMLVGGAGFPRTRLLIQGVAGGGGKGRSRDGAAGLQTIGTWTLGGKIEPM